MRPSVFFGTTTTTPFPPNPNGNLNALNGLLSGDDFEVIKRGGLFVKNDWLCSTQIETLRHDILSLQSNDDGVTGFFTPSGLSNRLAGDTNSFGSSDRLTCTITADLPGGNRRCDVERKLNELMRDLERELGIRRLELAEQYYSVSPVGTHLARHMDERHEETK